MLSAELRAPKLCVIGHTARTNTEIIASKKAHTKSWSKRPEESFLFISYGFR